MPGGVDHGPRLSGAEFDRRVAELYLGLPARPNAAEEREARRQELELRIDHRLGVGFPGARRVALWEVSERVGRQPFRMLLAFQLGRVLPRFLAAAARRLGGRVIEEYGRVLSPPELALFFGADEVASPGLPVDRSGGSRGGS